MIGGVASGTGLWVLGGFVPSVSSGHLLVGVTPLIVLLIARDSGWLTFPLPQTSHQVPQESLHGYLSWAFFKFGIELGVGFRTYLSASSPYAAAVIALLAMTGFMEGLLLGCCFGLGRASMPLLRSFSGHAQGWDRVLQERIHLIRVAALVGSELILVQL